MPLNSTDIENIKEEFAQLGFSIEEINLDGRLMITADEFFQLSLTYQVTDPSISVEYFSAFFTGILHDATGKPSIEAIIADLYNEAPGYKKDIKADVLYSKVDKPLPNKDQILRALRGLLILKGTVNKFLLDNNYTNDITNQIKHKES